MQVEAIAVCGLLLAPAPPAQAADSPLALTVVLEPRCPSVAPPLDTQSAIVAILLEGLASSLIDSAVDAAGAYLTAAASTKSVAFKGSRDDSFYSMDAKGDLLPARSGSGCLVMYVPGIASSKPWFDAARQRSSALGSQDKLPQLYIEIAFERSADAAQSLTLQNQFLHISKFQETGWSYRDDRNYSVAITLRNREDGQSFGSITFDFSKVRPGTFGESQVIKIGPNGSREIDSSIEGNLNPAASSQRVGFFPNTPAIEAASSAQKVVAAPFVKAARGVNKTPQEPLLNEPEWVVRTTGGTSPVQLDFVAKLEAFCESLEKQNKAGGDPRCPVVHLQASNDLEQARALLRVQLEAEWAAKFVGLHTAECKLDPQEKMICTAPAPKQAALGSFTWEATVVETREPTSFATAVANAFKSNKEKVKTELQNELPSKREEARRVAENTKRDALVTFKLAMLKVDEADAKLIEAAGEPRSSQVVLQADVLRAKVAANAAARAAGQPTPFDI